MQKAKYLYALVLTLTIVGVRVGTLGSNRAAAETNAILESWHFRVPIIDGGTITRLDNSFTYNGETKDCDHAGQGHFMDITVRPGNNDEGVPVYAVGEGKIIESDAFWNSDSNDFGMQVIQTSFGVTFRYEHLAKIYVLENQPVKQGDLIGLLGDTGESEGAHLHWDAWVTATGAPYHDLFQIQNVEQFSLGTHPCLSPGTITPESLDVNHWYHPEGTSLDSGCPNYFNKEAEFRASGLYHVTMFDHSNCLGNYKQIFAPASYDLEKEFGFNDRIRSIYIPAGNPILGIQGWSVKFYAHNDSEALVSSCQNNDMWNLDIDTYENSTTKIGFDRYYGLTYASNISGAPTQIPDLSLAYQTGVSNVFNMVSRIDVFDNPTCTPPPGGLVLGIFTEVGGIGGVTDSGSVASGDTVTVHADPPYTGTRYGWHDPGKYDLADYMVNKVTSVGVTSGWSIALFDGLNQTGLYTCVSSDDADLSNNTLSDGTNANDKAESVIVFNNSNCSGMDLPDLVAEEVFVSLTAGTTNFEVLHTGEYSYADWYFRNEGNTSAIGSFYADLWINNTRYIHYPFSDIGAQARIGFDDWSEIVPESGWITVRLVVDPDNTVTELDESNNVWEKRFFWDAPNYLEAVGCDNVPDPGVILAEDATCGGNFEFLWLPDTKNLTLVNERVSALRVPPGISVMVYKDPDLSGQKACFNGNIESLAQITWPDGSSMNDTISSFEVFFNEYCITQGSSIGQLVLYGGANYTSSATSFNLLGSYNLPGNVDNAISSMDIADGWSVLLYEGYNQSGSSVCRASDDSNFDGNVYDNGTELNNTISSIELFANSYCSHSTAPIPGDINEDETVDMQDYSIFANAFGWTGVPGAIAADINLDGTVDMQDYSIFANNFGVTSTITSQIGSTLPMSLSPPEPPSNLYLLLESNSLHTAFIVRLVGNDNATNVAGYRYTWTINEYGSGQINHPNSTPPQSQSNQSGVTFSNLDNDQSVIGDLIVISCGAQAKTVPANATITAYNIDGESSLVSISELLNIPACPVTLKSLSAQDGWILESSEFSTIGGTLNKNATTLRVGDDVLNKQYRSMLSFDTSSLPDNAIITSVTLKFKHAGVSGTNPFTTHGGLLADICRGAFKGSPALQLDDFKATCGRYKSKALIFANTTVENWYSQSLNQIDFEFINLNGVTQFRLRFAKDDNNDLGADFLKLYSGNALGADRPQLVIEYYVP